MLRFSAIWMVLLLFFSVGAWAQSTGEMTIVQDTAQVKNTQDDINPLAPAKAAFYSALFPGMGQVYNKKYWKLPIVYGAIGASTYSYLWNDKRYREFRNVYKRRLAGYTDDRYVFFDDDRVIQASRFYQKNRDLSALVTVAFYVLNIIDANVDAHLQQFNVSDNLTLNPQMFQDELYGRSNIGLSLNYKF